MRLIFIMTICVYVIVSIAFTGMFLELKDARKRIGQLNKELDYYHTTFRSKGGGTRLYNGKWIDYNLISIDSGKTWYDRYSNPLLPIEHRYPGFMRTLVWTDSITKIK